MKINKLLIAIVAALLVTSTFAAVNVFAVQPPIDTDTYYIGTIGQPRRMDPARAYDTASGDVIMNVYEPLVFFSDKPLAPVPSGTSRSTNMVAGPWADLSKFEPILATAMPTISPDGLTWTFTINTNAVFHDWKKADHTLVTGQHVTAEDVEYTFERAVVLDQIGSPIWMFCMPAFGYMWLGAPYGPYNTAVPADEAAMGALIDAFVETGPGNTVIFKWGKEASLGAWPQTALLQIFAQTWGCIVNKAFCIEHGNWDGSFAPGWAAKYQRKPSTSYSPLDRYYAQSKYASDQNENGWGAGDVPAMCGTGPYKFTSWDKANKRVRVDKFDNYWRGWTNAGDKAGNFISTVLWFGVDNWPTRKMLFLEGEFDTCAVPRANMYDLLEGQQQFQPISGLHLYYNTPALSNDVASFVFAVAAETPYHSKILGTNVDTFFGNKFIRNAFTFALDFPAYLADAWFNEAIQPNTWWVQGLKPDYELKTLVPKSFDLTKMGNFLKQATFAGVTPAGQSVFDTGFETYLVYNLGNDQRKIACDMIAQSFATLGAKYKVNVIGIDWPTFLDYEEEMFMPMFFVGWLADFADADNFARPYMHTYGDFSYFQGYSDPHVDDLIDTGIVTPDGPAREAIYKELQQIYYDDSPGLPLIQAVGRAWRRDWMRGWYYNQLYPGFLYYDYYKSVGALESVDLDITSTVTPVTFYPAIYWYGGKALIGNGNGGNAKYQWTVSVKRTDSNTNVGALLAAVGIKRVNSTGWLEFCNATTVILAPGGSASAPIEWWEDGSVSFAFAPGTWTLTGVGNTVTSNAQDANTANNEVAAGSMTATGPLVGDIKVDGIVDIYDAITLSGVYGKSTGQTGWRSDADLKADGTIDIYDAILLAGNFNKHIP